MLSRGGRRINGRQAEVVRHIFQDYADGKSPRRIAHDLNAEDVPGGAGDHAFRRSSFGPGGRQHPYAGWSYGTNCRNERRICRERCGPRKCPRPAFRIT
ncbi:MAG: recombinase family protein, partial [Gemmatimonadetes bacterium]|nr:recombinase family protein [Gemmatimonadota bacterium]